MDTINDKFNNRFSNNIAALECAAVYWGDKQVKRIDKPTFFRL